MCRHSVSTIVLISLFAGAGAGCALFPSAPFLTVTPDAIYAKDVISIPYSFATLTGGLAGQNATCRYEVEKLDQYDIPYPWLDGEMDLPPSGKLTIDLSEYHAPQTGASVASVVDGRYNLTFEVTTGNRDSSSDLIALPFLISHTAFSVVMSTGPDLFVVTPAVLNVADASPSVTLSGHNFKSTSLVNANPSSAVAVTNPPGSSTSITAALNIGSLMSGTSLPLWVSTGSLESQPIYVPLVGNPSINTLSPSSGSRGTGSLNIEIDGDNIGQWTNVAMTDAASQNVPISSVGSSPGQLVVTVDLADAATGYATVTVVNPDETKSSASSVFTVE